jgi:hypothetical protein
MKLSKLVLIGVILSGIGAVAGWTLRPAIAGDPSAPLSEYGGTSACGFKAEVTWHPETKIEGENFVMHQTTWKWVFHNRSDASIQFSIPRQEIQLDRSIYSGQFIKLPDSMLGDPPITIAPGEKNEFSARSGGMSWDKARNGEFGFRIVAKIDDTFHILGCAANVREAPPGRTGHRTIIRYPFQVGFGG